MVPGDSDVVTSVGINKGQHMYYLDAMSTVNSETKAVETDYADLGTRLMSRLH